MRRQWWKEAIAYQIYPRSFMDSNQDGIGDIQGIIQKLDYLKGLGVDVIWISPIYPSPNDDNGYDISDYQEISPEYGTLQDFDRLLGEVHRRGMKLIMDLVINHTSDEHQWFIESRSSKESEYRDFYIWHSGKEGKEPNNWASIFGGSAWEYDDHTNEYYLHVFSKKQPDLNWENPKVRHRLYEMVNWWLDKGIDGFRVDAISHIKKKKGFPDISNPQKLSFVPSFEGHMNQEGIGKFLSEFADQTIRNYDVMTVGEANGVDITNAKEWVGEENGYFNMIFQFEHLDLWGKSTSGSLDILKLKEVFTRWQKGLDGIGWNALFLENHDQPRSVSTWGNDKDLRITSAKAFATLYFLMQGTPFIYQGQELGMTNVHFESINDYNDVASKNLYKEETEAGKSHEEVMHIIWKNGRDNARTPMQWSSEPNAGFTTGTPWLQVNPNYSEINVEQSLADPNSIYHFYKKLIHLRKSSDTFMYGNYDLLLKNHPHVYAYSRTLRNDQYVIIINLFNECTTVELDKSLKNKQKALVLSNYKGTVVEDNNWKLRPYEVNVYHIKSSNN